MKMNRFKKFTRKILNKVIGKTKNESIESTESDASGNKTESNNGDIVIKSSHLSVSKKNSSIFCNQNDKPPSVLTEKHYEEDSDPEECDEHSENKDDSDTSISYKESSESEVFNILYKYF